MDDACTELDKLVVSCEFENQQFVKLIELEKQHIERYQQEIEFNSKETTRLHTAVAQLEDDIIQCNRQFTLNKANIESLKTTSHVLSEHAAAMAAKLELLQEQRRKQRMKHASQIEHYKDVWERYRVLYEKCPLAAELKNLESEKKELTERVTDIQLEKATVQKQGAQLEERRNISRMSLQQFIIKVAELQVKRTKLRNRLDTLQSQKNSQGKSQMAASLENNTQMLTAMQLEDCEHMESGEQINCPPAVEMTSPMITVFSDRDDVSLDGMEDYAQEIDSSLPCQELPVPEWMSMFQQKSEHKPSLTQHLEKTSPAQNQLKETDMDSENSPEVSSSNQESFTEPDEPMTSSAEDAAQEAHSVPYVFYTKRIDAEESVYIHLQTSTENTNPRHVRSHQQRQSPAMPVTSTMTSIGNTSFTPSENLPLSAPVAPASGRRFNIPSAPQIRIPTLNSRPLLSSAPRNITPSVSPNVPSMFVPQHIAQLVTHPPPVQQHPQVQIPRVCAPGPFTVKTPEIPMSPQLAYFATKVTSPRESTEAVSTGTPKESTKQMQVSPQEKQFQRPATPAVSVQAPVLRSPMVIQTPTVLRSPMVTQTPRFVVPAVSFGPRPAVSRLQSPRPQMCHVPSRSQGPTGLPKQLMSATAQDKTPQHVAASPARMMSSPSHSASNSPTASEDMEECSTYFLPMTEEESPHLTTISDSPDRSASPTGTTSPFDIEKHRQRMAEFKKSPGEPTFVANRRMFPNQSAGHMQQGGAGDHGNTDEGRKGSLAGMDWQMQMSASGDHGQQSSEGKKDYTPTTPSLFNFSDKENTSHDSPNVDRYLEMFGFSSNYESGDGGGFNFRLENSYGSDDPNTNKPLFAMDFGNEASTEKGSAFNFDFGFGSSADAVEGNSEPVFKINFGETSPGVCSQKGGDQGDNNLAMMFGNNPDGDITQEPAQEFKTNFKLF